MNYKSNQSWKYQLVLRLSINVLLNINTNQKTSYKILLISLYKENFTEKTESNYVQAFHPIVIHSLFTKVPNKNLTAEESSGVLKLNCLYCEKSYNKISKQHLKTRIYQSHFNFRENYKTKDR